MGRGNLKPHEEKLRLIIASNIRKLLDEKNLKAIDLKRGTGLPQSSISEYLNARATPTLGKVQKIADYFGVPKSEIDPSLSPNWIEPVDYNSSIIEETIETLKELEEPRQKVVLETAKSQLKEQETEKESASNIITLKNRASELTDEEFERALDEAVRQTVAFDGKPLDEREQAIAKQMLKDAWEEDNGKR